MLNEHFKNQFDSSNCAYIPDDLKESVLSDFKVMTNLEIDNDEDQNKFFLIRNHVPEIVFSMFNKKLNDKTAQAIAAEVFRNREKKPIGTLLELIEAIDLALKKMIPKENRPKLAYPQPNIKEQLPHYDIRSWVEATRKIYSLMSRGYTKDQAYKSVIGNWDSREKMDYKYWLKFYTEQVPEKYPKLATAQEFDGFTGGFPVVRRDVAELMANPAPMGQGRSIKQSPGVPQNLPHDQSDVRETIETQRRKLVSRLNSAEKLLSGMDGQLFAGDDQELMLKLLQDLKRRIQTINKRTIKSTLFEDHIYKEANLLQLKGKNKAAGFFYKLAQLPPPPGGLDLGPMPDESPSPSESSEPSGKGDRKETEKLLKEFFDNLKRGVNDKDDTVKEIRQIEKEDANNIEVSQSANSVTETTADADIEVIKIGSGFWIKNAQAPAPDLGAEPAKVPPAPASPASPTPEVPEQKTRTEDISVDTGGESSPDDHTDDIIEAALNQVNVNDVINRLEMLVSIYNQREVSRQLAILDIMMDKLGIASYFPSLGESMSKALDANQYIGSRLGDILTKLKGSMANPSADNWLDKPQEKNPETARIRNNLDREQAIEEERKEMRKEKDLAKLRGEPGGGAVPAGQSAGLQGPAKVERAPKIDVR